MGYTDKCGADLLWDGATFFEFFAKKYLYYAVTIKYETTMSTYLQQFFPCLENRHVYPYRVVYPMMLEHIDFAPITILYGNNGSGKSTLLNVMAS